MLERSMESTHLEWIINRIDVGVHLLDQEGITILYNDKMAEIDGLNRTQVIGKSVFDLYPSLTHETSTLIKVLRTGKEIAEHIQTYVNVSGKRITTVNSTFPLVKHNHIVGALEVAKDITSIVQLHDQILDLRHQLYRAQQHEQRRTGAARYHFSDLIGQSPLFLEALHIAKKAARTNSSVFICGATGTGKELIAQSIHNAGIRRDKPFIAQNCAAVPGELMEGLMFGTTRGAFTGAIDRPGLFEQANGGTLFLDELNSLDLYLQAKLLRVLQDGIVRRIGGTTEQQVHIRIIAAMNMEPKEALEKGILRSDLFYRLHVVHIHLPSLSQRQEDIQLLVQHYIEAFNPLFGLKVSTISTAALKQLEAYLWPGNIRELKHVIESAFNMMELHDEQIEVSHLPPYLHYAAVERLEHQTLLMTPVAELPARSATLPAMLEKYEREAIQAAMDSHQHNITLAAQALGIKRQALQYKLTRYGISRRPE